ncbi:hypothetical protein PHLCEN_2v48 [Hermanssonia centrifuga]|uniref:Uncharacterized protein n=1 Tax=Hermanssonia centrifuga TaxID=98765 RepID=A0A2R6S756_9APHY|nr:hypothetical protein PHLCEN_2v48 [Hermanssonia centrifuga]
MHSVLLVMNIADVIVNNVPSLQNVSPVPNLIQGLTSILISRFLLNLRQLGEPENETQSRFNSRFSIPGFRVPTLETVVGNMGADLGRGPAEEIDDEAEEVDMDGTDAQNVVLDGIAEDTSGGPVVESVYGIQEGNSTLRYAFGGMRVVSNTGGTVLQQDSGAEIERGLEDTALGNAIQVTFRAILVMNLMYVAPAWQ